MAERTRGRHPDNVRRLRPHRGIFHQLRLVEDGSPRRTGQQRSLLPGKAGRDLRRLPAQQVDELTRKAERDAAPRIGDVRGALVQRNLWSGHPFAARQGPGMVIAPDAGLVGLGPAPASAGLSSAGSATQSRPGNGVRSCKNGAPTNTIQVTDCSLGAFHFGPEYAGRPASSAAKAFPTTPESQNAFQVSEVCMLLRWNPWAALSGLHRELRKTVDLHCRLDSQKGRRWAH